MINSLCLEDVSLVLAISRYQRDIYGSKLVPGLVKEPTPETRQAVGRQICFRGMGGSFLKDAGSKGQAASTAGRSSRNVNTCPYRWQRAHGKSTSGTGHLQC